MSSGLRGRSSQVRHRNALTEKAREDAVKGIGKLNSMRFWSMKGSKRSEPAGQFVTTFAESFGNAWLEFLESVFTENYCHLTRKGRIESFLGSGKPENHAIVGKGLYV